MCIYIYVFSCVSDSDVCFVFQLGSLKSRISYRLPQRFPLNTSQSFVFRKRFGHDLFVAWIFVPNLVFFASTKPLANQHAGTKNSQEADKIVESPHWSEVPLALFLVLLRPNWRYIIIPLSCVVGAKK